MELITLLRVTPKPGPTGFDYEVFTTFDLVEFCRANINSDRPENEADELDVVGAQYYAPPFLWMRIDNIEYEPFALTEAENEEYGRTEAQAADSPYGRIE